MKQVRLPCNSDTWKRALRAKIPRATAYAAHLKALYENEVELRLLPWLCRKEEIAIDVGAFTGTYAVGLSRCARMVVAVEPQPWQAENLRRSMPKNVKVVEAALSDVSGSARMRLSSPHGGSMSSLCHNVGTEGWLEITVHVARMDEMRCGAVGFIKIDAEGHEVQVLNGGVGMLQADHPNILVEIEERHQAGSIDRVFALMQQLGYKGYFVRRGHILPIAEFSLSRDQDQALLAGGKRNEYIDYINNFIFLHPKRSTCLPAQVPSPLQASLTTIVRSI